MQKFITKIDTNSEEILKKLDDECYILSTTLPEEYCEKFIIEATKKEKIVLFYGDNAIEKTKHFGTDGVVLELPLDGIKDKVREIRKALKKQSIIGLITRSRRHESMVTSEAEPDFIIFKIYKDGFENLKELTSWYNDFFLIQSASLLMEDDIPYQELQTDFIIKSI